MSLQKEDIQNLMAKLSSREVELVLMKVCERVKLNYVTSLAGWLDSEGITYNVRFKLNRELVNVDGRWTSTVKSR